MDLANSAVKTALDLFLELHKDAKSDNEFTDIGFNIIQTLLNNIHMAQSHMFAKLIGGITNESHTVCTGIELSAPKGNLTATNVTPVDTVDEELKVINIKSYEPEIDDYMSQFSNATVCNGFQANINATCVTPSTTELSQKRFALGLNPNSKKGPIDDWLQKRDPLRQSPYNVFDEDIRVTESLDVCNTTDVRDSIWHEKVNMDVEQCCARIGKQIFIIDHMESEFLDNYPPDTYIDESGVVHGRSCLRTIDTKLFEKGQIFCTDHAYGYEDIRKPLSLYSSHNHFPNDERSDIDFM